MAVSTATSLARIFEKLTKEGVLFSLQSLFQRREHNRPAVFSIMQLLLVSPCSVRRMELSQLPNPGAFCEVAAQVETAVKPGGAT
jgi:hypothetical protein